MQYRPHPVGIDVPLQRFEDFRLRRLQTNLHRTGELRQQVDGAVVKQIGFGFNVIVNLWGDIEQQLQQLPATPGRGIEG